MNYKSLIVAITEVSLDRAAIDRAAALAARFDAHLTGLFIYEPPYYHYPLAYPNIADLDPEAAGGTDAATQAARAAFESACRAHGVETHEWRFVRGETLHTLALHARYADAMLMSGGHLAARLAIVSSRPVITVPEADRDRPLGRRIVLAWNASREATRAATSALPLMVGAERLCVLVIDSNGASQRQLGANPGADIALYLARHGVEAQVRHADKNTRGIADTLLTEALEMDADLICMGAYGHSRLRELVLGGVTRDVIDAPPPVPLLLAH
ncbi:universal stress protein [Salinisphaera sp.]|uniref:universal stress protein n=1 Tax=Salinisphaera sp. TaxID=1914330 RepID=UPI002D777A9C|nr:universal stress protein [Salinisphaera sp.]HET7313343.1 universal stress protein [Salinisphaera sp.]